MEIRPFIESLDINCLLPSEYARFSHALSDGLIYFLTGLEKDVQEAIFRDQLALGPSATVAKRLGCLARNSPVLHKLGQVLARNQKLPLSLRLELQKLECLAPTVSTADIKRELEHELGSLKAHGITLGANDLAEASVAVIIPFSRGEDSDRDGQQSFNQVFKVLKPGIEKRLLYELDLLEEVGELLESINNQGSIPELKYHEIFQQVTTALRNEVRLVLEQENLREAAESYKGLQGIKIPQLQRHCSARVTAMERIKGYKLDAASIPSLTRRKRFADLVARSLVTFPFFSIKKRTLFHADPHAGNLYCTDSGDLALLDWSQVGYITYSQQNIVSRIMLAALTLQQDKIAQRIEEFSLRPIADVTILKKVIHEKLQTVRMGRLPGLTWLLELFDHAAVEAGVQFPGNVLLFRKSLLTVTGIVEELSGSKDYMDTAVVQEFLKIFATEWPGRWLPGAEQASRSSHLSNFDLMDAALDAWVAPIQQYMNLWSIPFGWR